MIENKKFYVTISRNHGGPGYVLVRAKDEEEARTKMVEKYGRKWAFIYNDLDKVHVLDQIKLGQID